MKFQAIQSMETFWRPLCIEMESQSSTEHHSHDPGKATTTVIYQQTDIAIVPMR
jgi:hypothetical protein